MMSTGRTAIVVRLARVQRFVWIVAHECALPVLNLRQNLAIIGRRQRVIHGRVSHSRQSRPLHNSAETAFLDIPPTVQLSILMTTRPQSKDRFIGPGYGGKPQLGQRGLSTLGRNPKEHSQRVDRVDRRASKYCRPSLQPREVGD